MRRVGEIAKNVLLIVVELFFGKILGKCYKVKEAKNAAHSISLG